MVRWSGRMSSSYDMTTFTTKSSSPSLALPVWAVSAPEAPASSRRMGA